MGELGQLIERLMQGLGRSPAGARIASWLSDNGYMPIILWSAAGLVGVYFLLNGLSRVVALVKLAHSEGLADWACFYLAAALMLIGFWFMSVDEIILSICAMLFWYAQWYRKDRDRERAKQEREEQCYETMQPHDRARSGARVVER